MTVEYAPEIDELANTQVGQLANAEGIAQEAIVVALTTRLAAQWASFDSYYEGDAVQKFASTSAALVRAAQRQAGRVTEVHLRRQYQRLGVELSRTAIVDLPDDLRLGASTEDVYQRPVRTVRYLLSDLITQEREIQREVDEQAAAVERELKKNRADVLEERARRNAADRLNRQALMDVQLARATAAQQVLYAAPETPVGTTVGWRRIIHPEIGAVCGLCVAASDRTYQRINRMDLHGGCKCTVLPVIVNGNGEVLDPGRSLNAADLAAIYGAAGGSTNSRALSQTRIQVQENGELGPILMADGVQYKGPQQVREQMSDEAAQRRLASINNQLAALRKRKVITAWHADRIEQLEELLAA